MNALAVALAGELPALHELAGELPALRCLSWQVSCPLAGELPAAQLQGREKVAARPAGLLEVVCAVAARLRGSGAASDGLVCGFSPFRFAFLRSF